ncbi:MAG: hypothetical protein LBV78_00730, partial [Kitasatospora sp.]|nr:hypothetical protein [Kitasatospora sp.]
PQSGAVGAGLRRVAGYVEWWTARYPERPLTVEDLRGAARAGWPTGPARPEQGPVGQGLVDTILAALNPGDG